MPYEVPEGPLKSILLSWQGTVASINNIITTDQLIIILLHTKKGHPVSSTHYTILYSYYD